MLTGIEERTDSLATRGSELLEELPQDQHGLRYWVRERDIPEYQAWMSSVANLISTVAPRDSHFISELGQLLSHSDLKKGIPSSVVQKLVGLLIAFREEWGHGLLRRVEFLVAAATFDDFLDHAAVYHRGNKKIEAAVLASAVFEDSVKKIATRNGLEASARTLDPIIDELAKACIITPVLAKRWKSCSAVRNHALHAEWDAFDIKDVGELIGSTRAAIEDLL